MSPELLRPFTPTSAGAGEAQQPLPNGAHRRSWGPPQGILKCGQSSKQAPLQLSVSMCALPVHLPRRLRRCDAAAHRASCDAGGSAPTQGTCSEVDSAEQEVNSERATQSRGLDAEALSWPRRSQGASNSTRTAKLGVARRAHPAKPAAAAWDTLAAGQARRSPAP